MYVEARLNIFDLQRIFWIPCHKMMVLHVPAVEALEVVVVVHSLAHEEDRIIHAEAVRELEADPTHEVANEGEEGAVNQVHAVEGEESEAAEEDPSSNRVNNHARDRNF